jgi:hypothetical protein
MEFIWRVPVAGQAVLTGHANGSITMNLLQADDDQREGTRVAQNEPQRSLVGHLPHEVSHHPYQRFVLGAGAGAQFSDCFGDAAADDAQALHRHHQQGSLADWPVHFISAYAGVHPLKDWAEACARHMLMVDTLQTAAALGAAVDQPAAAADGRPGGENPSELD